MMMLFVSGVIIFNAVGALFLKRGSKKFFFSFSLKFLTDILKNNMLIIGIIAYAISTVFFIFAIRIGRLTLVYSLTSLSYVLISLLSIYFLKEKMNWYKWLGIFLVMLGVVLVKL